MTKVICLVYEEVVRIESVMGWDGHHDVHDQGSTFTLTLILGSHYMSRIQNRGRRVKTTWVIRALILGTIWFCTEINRSSLEIPTIFYKIIINPGLSTVVFFFWKILLCLIFQFPYNLKFISVQSHRLLFTTIASLLYELIIQHQYHLDSC